jgi:4-hydroxy-tetrahydrodipicolinate synthase
VDRQTIIQQLRGCFIAIPTQFQQDFSLNLEGMRQHVHFMIDNGLRLGNATFLVNGATGEFPVLDFAERRRTAETVVEAAAGRVAIIVGGQALGTLQAIEVARHAQEIGATALQVSPPFYFPATDDDVYAHVAAIADAVPELAIVFYPTWWLGYHPSLAMVERLSGIPQVTAMKWSAPGVLEYQLGMQRFADRLGMIDNMLLPVLNKMLGGTGANLHPAMFWPEWGVRIWSSLEAGEWDDAQAEVNRFLLPYYEIITAIGEFTGGEGHIDKLALELVGLPGGPTRPPTRPLPAEFRGRLRRLCADVGAPLARL